jgi:hypothetical protein
MKPLLRVAVCGVVLGLVVALVGCVLVPWLGGPALFAVDGPALCRLLWMEHVRGDALETRDEALRHCLAGKVEVTEEVIAGRLSLAEAIDRFRRLHALLDDGQDEVLGSTSPAGDDEEVARNVIRWVSHALNDQPSRRVEVVARLEKEMADLPSRRSR